MPQHGPPGNPHNEPPGLVRRRLELERAKTRAGRDVMRTPDTPMERRDLGELRRASNALQRQEDEHKRRLRRAVGEQLGRRKG